jgi:hypothetical protein
MPELTSIKVSRPVRDRFAAAARARKVTMSVFLDQLSREVADNALMEQVAAQMSHMRESDPGAWADYVHEGTTWEEATIEHLDA